MKLSDLHRKVKRRPRRRRVGRGPGSGWGTTAGRGHKGFFAHSGNVLGRGYEGGQMPYFRRIPKRGFNNANFRREFALINLGDLGDFAAGATVGPEDFLRAGLIRRLPDDGVKILATGTLDRPLTVQAHAFSHAAEAKLVAAGGKAELIGPAAEALRRPPFGRKPARPATKPKDQAPPKEKAQPKEKAPPKDKAQPKDKPQPKDKSQPRKPKPEQAPPEPPPAAPPEKPQDG